MSGEPPGFRLGVAGLQEMVTAVGAMPVDDMGSAQLIDVIRVLEEVKSAASAAQARAAAHFDSLIRDGEAAAGVPPSKQGTTVAAQVALARRESPSKGSRLLGLGKALTHELPHTMAALAAGLISEWRATLITRETACLSVEDRATVDRELFADPAVVERMGDRRLAAEARRIATRLDAAAVAARAAKAEKERTVTCRPAPDTMTWLTGLLPVRQGVAVYVALSRAADAARAAGDSRTRGQVMADTLFERVTGRDVTDPVDVQIQLVMTDTALLDGGTEPAWVTGYGPIPSSLARAFIAGEADRPVGSGESGAPAGGTKGTLRQARVWVRRLYTTPGSGELVAMDARTRHLPSVLRDFIRTRDQFCRTPWCDAPIRHDDHITAHAAGGPTSAENVQGLCERCNYTKEQPGWRSTTVREADESARHTVVTTTPTGHSYASTAPPISGQGAAKNVGGRA